MQSLTFLSLLVKFLFIASFALERSSALRSLMKLPYVAAGRMSLVSSSEGAEGGPLSAFLSASGSLGAVRFVVVGSGAILETIGSNR